MPNYFLSLLRQKILCDWRREKVKTMTLYIAYDDTEFTDESECRAYEEEAENFLEELDYAYNFYDKDGNIILPICDDTIEDYLEWFDATTDKCEYIRVYKNVSRELHNFLRRNISACVPEEKGFYKYDWNKNEWVSAN